MYAAHVVEGHGKGLVPFKGVRLCVDELMHLAQVLWSALARMRMAGRTTSAVSWRRLLIGSRHGERLMGALLV